MKIIRWLQWRIGRLLGSRLQDEPSAFWKVVTFLVATGMKLNGWTWRVRIEDRAGFLDGKLTTPGIFIFWHNRQLLIPGLHQRFYGDRKGTVILTSASREGSLVAMLLSHFGMGAVRGSNSRHGSTAIVELQRALVDGYDVGITPDGPRGPRYFLHPGAMYLARESGVPIMCLHVECDWRIRLNSWDGFILPLPFSKVRLIIESPITVPADCDVDALEEHRARVEDILISSLEVH